MNFTLQLQLSSLPSHSKGLLGLAEDTTVPLLVSFVEARSPRYLRFRPVLHERCSNHLA